MHFDQSARGHHDDLGLGFTIKPSLRVSANAEGPHVIGRESDLLKFNWLDILHVSRQFCM